MVLDESLECTEKGHLCDRESLGKSPCQTRQVNFASCACVLQKRSNARLLFLFLFCLVFTEESNEMSRCLRLRL